MTAVLPSALAPVSEALLAAARSDAAALLAAADAEVAETLSAAHTQASQILATAQAEGTADAEAALAGERARAHRRARATVLRARRDAFDEVRGASLTAAGALRDEPAYPGVREGLAAAIRADLGPAAALSDDPSGGLFGEAGNRRVDFSLRGFVDRAVDALGAELERTWAP